MKRTSIVTVLVVSVLLLSACGTSATSTAGAAGTGGTARRGLTITPGIKLALGTIKLEGTLQAVDQAMAAKLLPLWQLLLQLDGSTSAAPQEVTAVLDTIRATMTPAQVSAISSMQITQADFGSLFQGQGASGTARAGGANGGGGGGFAGGGPPGGGFAGGGAPGGGFGGGGFGGGGGIGGGAARPSGTATAGTTGGTTAARSQSTVAVPGFLVNQVISLLQSKITG